MRFALLWKWKNAVDLASRRYNCCIRQAFLEFPQIS